MADDALRATLAVTSTLDALGLEYLIGGSLASSIHGRHGITPRAGGTYAAPRASSSSARSSSALGLSSAQASQIA